MIGVNLQFQTNVGGPTAGGPQKLASVPRIGETIVTGNGEFFVIDVRWEMTGYPTVIARPK